MASMTTRGLTQASLSVSSSTRSNARANRVAPVATASARVNTTPSTLAAKSANFKGVALSSKDSSKAAGRRSLVVHAADTVAAAAAEPEDPKFLGISTFTLKKVIPLGLMFFCILFNYTILRDTKDVLVVTAPGSGAETIPFLKTWVNLPMAIGFMVLYNWYVNVMAVETVFYVVIFPFIAFFVAFAFIMYPAQHLLHPVEWCQWLLSQIGERFFAPVSIIRNWTYCLFYVMAELWGSVVVSVLFWGFANQITTVDEAKSFYPLFGLGANVALVFSGMTVKAFSQIRANLPPGADGWGYSLKGMMAMVGLFGFFVVAIYWGMNRTIVPEIERRGGVGQKKKKKGKKPKLGMSESLGFLLKSPYIRDMATLVVAYGISINLVEVTWKGKLKAQFPNPNEYSSFMGEFSACTGIVTFTLMLISRVIFRKYGWGVAALITPTVLLITGVIFFGLVLGGTALAPSLAMFGLTPLYAAVLVGAAQNIFSKGSKYALFDPCKEMAYIPLDEETRMKGKAAIDVVCNPLGKSGGSTIQQFLIIGFGSLASSTPYLAVILFAIVGVWIKAAISLNKQFVAEELKMLSEKLDEAAEENPGVPPADLEFKSERTEDGGTDGKFSAPEK